MTDLLDRTANSMLGRPPESSERRIKPWSRARQMRGMFLLSDLRECLPEYAKVHLTAAFSGNAEAACSLACAAPNKYRGHIVLAAYLLGMPDPAYSELFQQVWGHDYGYLLAAADKRTVRRMMKAARVEHPFSGPLKVFRGTSGLTLRQTARGLSWSADREVACWFAHRYATPDRKPLVAVSTVDAADIIFYDNSRCEQEVILGRPVTARLDDEPDTWQRAADRQTVRIDHRNSEPLDDGTN